MSRIVHNKLVRDAKPEAIRRSGGDAVVSTLRAEDRRHHLCLKLLEEAYETYQSGADADRYVDEAADLLEVLRALASELGVDWDTIEQRRIARQAELGGFSRGVFLECVRTGADNLEFANKLASTPCLLTRSSVPSLLDVLRRELGNSRHCRIATAFCTRAMLNQLLRPFEAFLQRGGRLQILTSVMNNFNNPDDLVHLRGQLEQSEVRVFYPGTEDPPDRFVRPPAPFHLKSFLFEKLDDRHSLIVGSSNLTTGGLQGNEEWNLYSNSEVNLAFNADDARTIYETARVEFDRHWSDESVEITPDFLEAYRPRWERARVARRLVTTQIIDTTGELLRPRPAQQEALAQLALRRRLGVRKTVVIGATGLGKTHLAAFDFRQSGMENVLFLVHRENILVDARTVFRQVLDDGDFGVILSGNTRPDERDAALQDRTSVFAMIQTLSRPEWLARFSPNHFDYVVIDEFHHSEAASYQKVLSHSDPAFLLGLTATPERMDGRDVLRFCDFNIAYEARLFDAIEQGWLAPFQYYAIHDETDYSHIRWTGIGYDETQLERGLSTDTRAELIVRNLEKFLPATGKIKALAFCATKGHARFMAKQLGRCGFPAECLLGESSEDARSDAIRRLQDEADPLQVICSVDIFAEGVDIPAVSHVLMLRPTMSFTVFLQQLGRGLRKVPDKEYLVVLDFVGNHRNSYVAPLVMWGFTSLDQYKKERGAKQIFRIPSCCTVDVDVQVQRVWDNEIRRVCRPQTRRELLTLTYEQMRSDLGHPPSLLDFLANPDACDPHAFVQAFDNWLRTKQAMGDLTEYERSLLDTPGEAMLQHVEKELNPNRSYKMVVLTVLLDDRAARTQWKLEWIAEGFAKHYLQHLEQLGDCSVLAGAADPESVPLSKIVTLVRSNPLNYLSNTPQDYFTLDRTAQTFSVRPEVQAFWRDPQFRALLKERVSYALFRYFHGKGINLNDYGFDPDEFRTWDETVPIVQPPTPATPMTALPFYPTLRIAAGIFREAATEFDARTIDVPDPRQRFRPDRHFVVQIDGDSMDGGSNPILDGDLVVLERLGSSRAGSLTVEAAIAVEFRDDTEDTSYALKKIRKDARGQYWLHSWNRQFKDVQVVPDRIFTFARFICKVGESG
jgi:superfamily II DNA or RNA helicase/HKD family nuclease/predicted house-cleaning noncanonical NTP pyrophosphatase (MazG superfamily)/SOS-response transcriptional repressor LexA